MHHIVIKGHHDAAPRRRLHLSFVTDECGVEKMPLEHWLTTSFTDSADRDADIDGAMDMHGGGKCRYWRRLFSETARNQCRRDIIAFFKNPACILRPLLLPAI